MVFASIDVHNNTGLNPHYACVNVIDNRFLHLAAMFGRTVVLLYPALRCAVAGDVQNLSLCNSRCGKPGQLYGVEHARDYLNSCLHLAQHPEHPIPASGCVLICFMPSQP